MEKSFKENILSYGLCLTGLVIMILSSTKWTKWTEVNPLIWLLSGSMFIFFIFKIIGKNNVKGFSQNKIIKASWLLSTLLLAIAGYIIYEEMMWVFEAYADKTEGSDVIPSLEAYVTRLLNGEEVYVEIPFENYSVLPTYFPAMWMPYIIPELLGFDYRLMAIGSFFVLYAGINVYYLKKFPSIIHAIISSILPVLFVKWYVHYDVSVFVFATELMPLVFYMLLVLGLTQKKWWLIGISIGLCTMSRYSYTLFIIPFVAIIWKEWGFNQLLKIGITGSLVIVFIYILPFLIQDPSILTDGFAYYSRTVSDQWQTQFWQPDGAIPYHLNNGLSFSYYFYMFIDGEPSDKLDVAKIINLISALIAASLIIFFRYNKPIKIKWNDYLAISLFLYLIIFYSLLYVPFSYLFMLPLGLGLCLFSIYGSRLLKY